VKLLEPSDLGLGEGLEREVGERRSAPHRERLGQARRAVCGIQPFRLAEHSLEAECVDLIPLDLQEIARRSGQHSLGAEHLPELRDEVLK
jgi:hypothetical protein